MPRPGRSWTGKLPGVAPSQGLRYRYLPAEIEAMADGRFGRSRACLLAVKERNPDDSARPQLGTMPSAGASARQDTPAGPLSVAEPGGTMAGLTLIRTAYSQQAGTPKPGRRDRQP